MKPGGADRPRRRPLRPADSGHLVASPRQDSAATPDPAMVDGSNGVVISGATVPLRWRRSGRARRIALRIDPLEGDIVITLPARASRRDGLAFLRSHEAWLADRLASLPSRLEFAPGMLVPVDAIPRLVVHVPEARGGVRILDREIVVSGEAAFVRRRVRDALCGRARETFTRVAFEKARMIGIRPSRIRIRDTISRWGSCAPDRTLMFCWRLVMAPPFVQDYVVAHEVAHLRHMDHGPAFWLLTEQLTDHRAGAALWLARNGPALLRIG